VRKADEKEKEKIFRKMNEQDFLNNNIFIVQKIIIKLKETNIN